MVGCQKRHAACFYLSITKFTQWVNRPQTASSLTLAVSTIIDKQNNDHDCSNHSNIARMDNKASWNTVTQATRPFLIVKVTQRLWLSWTNERVCRSAQNIPLSLSKIFFLLWWTKRRMHRTELLASFQFSFYLTKQMRINQEWNKQ